MDIKSYYRQATTQENTCDWEFPPEQRSIHRDSIPVLQQRLHTLPLPDRRALAQRLAATQLQPK
ncbi:MAG: hypothetical protein R3E79_52650 [Caldilineaceae bacterium]